MRQRWDGVVLGLPQHQTTPSNHRRQAYTTKQKVVFAIRNGFVCLMTAVVVGVMTFLVVKVCLRAYAEGRAQSYSANWSGIARERAYEPCYNGCADCLDTQFALRACEKTTEVNVPGVICDGNQLWNWQHRYPDVCLEALGEMYRTDFKRTLLQSSEWRLLLTVLPIFFSLVVFLLVGRVCLRGYKRKFATAASAIAPAPTNGASIPLSTIVPPPARASSATVHPYSDPAPPYGRPHRSSRRIDSLRGGGTSFDPELEKVREELNEPQEQSEQGTAEGTSGKLNSKSTFRRIPAVLGIAALFGRTNATGAPICMDDLTVRHFANADHTIFGNVRGWLASECGEFPCYCRDVNCPPNQGWTAKPSNCERECDVCTSFTTGSLEYVDRIKPKVGYCDFEFVDVAVGEAPWRVANAMIEEKWLVTIAVNTFNTSGVTAPEVTCLHDIGDQFP
ncbi:hypothetical protein Vi05172_g10359 [Venturia inaequalis]|nr:hypothetical protein Vi05172_g10359 [Venturia inaequalis]